MRMTTRLDDEPCERLEPEAQRDRNVQLRVVDREIAQCAHARACWETARSIEHAGGIDR